MCPLKLTDFCPYMYKQSYIILQGPLIPPMAFTSCHVLGSNLLPPDGRASALTTQPIRLASGKQLAIGRNGGPLQLILSVSDKCPNQLWYVSTSIYELTGDPSTSAIIVNFISHLDLQYVLATIEGYNDVAAVTTVRILFLN